MKDLIRRRPLVTAAVALAAAAVVYLLWPGGDDTPQYETVRVGHDSIRSTVSATGTLSALVTVEVGSQLSGQISELHADFNSEVAAGQIIARLDPASFEMRVVQARAELAIAEASVLQAEASVAETKAAADDAKRNFERQKELKARGNISQAQLDTAMTEADKAAARLHSAEAQVATARAQVQQRQASLDSAEVDLERTFIRSPVDGVVIGRDVDIGQTVAASLQAPILFTIARDLSRMQLEVNIDEADIGLIREGQGVAFSVDAYPRRSFSGRVEQIRKAPQAEKNVVTYTVIVSAANEDQKLLPGMTANVEVIVDEKEDVLALPNRALTFRPPDLQSRRTAETATVAPTKDENAWQARVWVMTDRDDIEPRVVALGISNGQIVEVIDGLDEGDRIVVGSTTVGQSSESSSRRRFGPGPF